MATSSHADIEQRVLRARVQLALQQPFLAAALMRLPFRECKGMAWCPTMATDGYHIYFNPEWTSSLKDAEIRGVIAHEMLHVLFAHAERISGRHHRTWNLACDFAINLLLIEQGFALPEGGAYSRDYEGLAAEDIYAKLLTRLGKLPDSTRVSIYRLPEAENAGLVPVTGIDLLSPNDPRIAPLRDKDTPDSEQLAELREGLRQQAKSNLSGRAAAYFQIECAAASAANVDWRALLRNWLHDRIKSDWSTYPFSKKYIHRGLFMPSASVESPGHIVFAIDTSGSMSDGELNEIVAEIRAFRETFPSRLTIIQADAAIHSVTEYADFDGTEMPKSVTLQGRGGTDFRPVFEWLGKEASGPSTLLIYCTDGFGIFPDWAPEFPVIWLLSPPSLDPARLPFGSSFRLR